MKICPISLATKENILKPQRAITTPRLDGKIKQIKMPDLGKDVEQTECSYTIYGNKSHSVILKNSQFLIKMNSSIL